MKRLSGILLIALITAAIAFAAWYYRPWSPFSPASLRALDNPAEYVTTFQRMDELLPSTRIVSQQPQPLPRRLQPLDITYEWQGESHSLDTYLSQAQVTGLTVIHQGHVVYQQFLHGADTDTRFTSWSVAKGVVATLTAMALKDGLIDSLDDPVERYAPEYAGSYYGTVSLRHLLMMSAGVDFNEEYSADQPSDVRPFFFNAFILGRSPDSLARRVAKNSKLKAGEHFHYASTNTQVLSAVVRNVFDAPLASVVEERIWTPLGMSADATWLQHRNGEQGIAVGYCCLQATSEDYAHLGQLYLQNGNWNGAQLLPDGWVQEVTQPASPAYQAGATAGYGLQGYGLHFWVPQDADGEYFFAGVYGQYIWIDSKRQVVIAQQAGNPNWANMSSETFAVMRAIAAQLGNDLKHSFEHN